MIKLENWSVGSDSDPYTPPEAQSYYLMGQVYGHPRFADGKSVNTSLIKKVEGNTVLTINGSLYELGESDPKYVEWCIAKQCHIPTKECPIKVRK